MWKEQAKRGLGRGSEVPGQRWPGEALRRGVALCVLGCLVLGCAATSPSIMVLPHGQANLASFQEDDVRCQEYALPAAKAVANKVGTQNAGRALFFGLLGAAVGASVGGGFGLPGYGAQIGGTSWMAHGMAAGSVNTQGASQQAFDIAYAQCMRTKGHKLPGFQSIDDQPVHAAVPPQEPARAAAPTQAPQCADATVRQQCPLYQYRTGVYRGTCQDSSALEVGPDYVKGFPPTMGQRPHPWQAEGCVVANTLPTF